MSNDIVRMLYNSLYHSYILNNVDEIITVKQKNINEFIEDNSMLLYNITFNKTLSTRELVAKPLHDVTILNFFKKEDNRIMSDKEINRKMEVVINITLCLIELLNIENFKYKFLHNYIIETVEATVRLIKLLRI